MRNNQRVLFGLIVSMALNGAIVASADAQQSSANAAIANTPNVLDGIVSNPSNSPEISTAELRAALKNSSAIILDARAYEEYAVSHIPGAWTVPGKPGTTPALYVADVRDILKRIPDKTQPLIVYCNGMFCGRSERFADELMKAGYRNVRRYQLGAPAWRALGGVMQVEKPALLQLLAQDKTSVLIDGRDEMGSKPRVRNAVSIPLRDTSKAKDDGRLPMTDHNTRIFVVGENGAQACIVAEAIVHDAFHNVTFFDGTIADLPELIER